MTEPSQIPVSAICWAHQRSVRSVERMEEWGERGRAGLGGAWGVGSGFMAGEGEGGGERRRKLAEASGDRKWALGLFRGR